MEGDDGGQIYLTIPVSLIECNEKILIEIIRIIDGNQWLHNSEDMRKISYECIDFNSNNTIPGGMGGGYIFENDIWIHENIKKVKDILKSLIMINLSKSETAQYLTNLLSALSSKNST